MILRCFASRILVTAGVTLCVFSMVENAEATCGDWLAEPHSEMQESTAHDAKASEDESDDELTENPASEKPCHGPSCRKDSRQPIAPAPAPPNTSHRDLVAIALTATADTSDGNVNTLYEREVSASQGHPTEIDHPPRF